METVFIGIGSNLGSREEQLRNAVNRIVKLSGGPILVSPVYETAPWGFIAENDFLNAVVRIETGSSPQALLSELLSIEQEMGRSRPHPGYSSRTIDLDLLLFGNSIVHEKGLDVPHLHLHERKFVLAPLADLAPGLVHPELKKTVRQLLDECSDTGLVIKTDFNL